MSQSQQDFVAPTIEEMKKFMNVSAPSVAGAPSRSEVAIVDLKKLALSRFGDWRKDAAAVIAKYSGVIFDAQTPKGYKALEQAISEVRAGRYMGQRVSKASKTELADVSRAVGAEETAIAEFLGPTEQELLRQKKAEDDRRAAVVEAARAAEAERKAKHEAGIAKILSMPASARGKPSDRIAAGIDYVRGLAFGAEWEEYAGLAAIARGEVAAELESMFLSTKAAEEAEATAAVQRAEQARVAEAQRVEAERLKAQYEAMVARQREDTAAADALAKAQADFAEKVAAFEAAQQAADERRAAEIALLAAEAQRKPYAVSAPWRQITPEDLVFRPATEPAAQTIPNKPQGGLTAVQTRVEVIEPEASSSAKAEDLDGSLAAGDAPYTQTATPDDRSHGNPAGAGPTMDAATLALLRDALELTQYCDSALTWPSAPPLKTRAEWWAGLRMHVDHLRPLLIAAIGEG